MGPRGGVWRVSLPRAHRVQPRSSLLPLLLTLRSLFGPGEKTSPPFYTPKYMNNSNNNKHNHHRPPYKVISLGQHVVELRNPYHEWDAVHFACGRLADRERDLPSDPSKQYKINCFLPTLTLLSLTMRILVAGTGRVAHRLRMSGRP